MKKKIPTRTADLIKASRKAQGLSQGEMAFRMGYKSPQFISNVERGLCGVPVNSFKTMAKVLKIDIYNIYWAHVRDYAYDIKRKLRI